jgi:hypothetical protein
MRKIPQRIQLIDLQRRGLMKMIISASRDILQYISPVDWISVARIVQFEMALRLFPHPLSQLRSIIRAGKKYPNLWD